MQQKKGVGVAFPFSLSSCLRRGFDEPKLLKMRAPAAYQ